MAFNLSVLGKLFEQDEEVLSSEPYGLSSTMNVTSAGTSSIIPWSVSSISTADLSVEPSLSSPENMVTTIAEKLDSGRLDTEQLKLVAKMVEQELEKQLRAAMIPPPFVPETTQPKKRRWKKVETGD